MSVHFGAVIVKALENRQQQGDGVHVALQLTDEHLTRYRNASGNGDVVSFSINTDDTTGRTDVNLKGPRTRKINYEALGALMNDPAVSLAAEFKSHVAQSVAKILADWDGFMARRR